MKRANLDPIKQAQEVIFTRKLDKEHHPQFVFEQYQKLIHTSYYGLFSITVWGMFKNDNKQSYKNDRTSK